jgi:putative transposase
MDKPITLSFRRRNLPHWRVADRSYFVTFRLKHTLPADVVAAYREEIETLHAGHASPEDLKECHRRHFRKIEAILHRNDAGCRHLAQPPIARLVLEAFDFIESRYHWRVPCAVVMPNHVHCLCAGQADAVAPLEKALGVLKGWTGREANRILGLQGAFWAPENFDHWCRTAESLDHFGQYIVLNPVKAGLVKTSEAWPWLRIK